MNVVKFHKDSKNQCLNLYRGHALFHIFHIFLSLVNKPLQWHFTVMAAAIYGFRL